MLCNNLLFRRAAEEEIERQEKKKRKKNTALLSFGDAESNAEGLDDAEATALPQGKMKSAHDVGNDPR